MRWRRFSRGSRGAHVAYKVLERTQGGIHLDGYVDGDVADDRVIKSSASSHTIIHGGCNLVDGSKAQNPIGTSSGEAEWYSTCSGSSEAIHVAHICRFVFGKQIHIVMWADSTVCKAVGNLQGVVNLKRLETKSLWL